MASLYGFGLRLIAIMSLTVVLAAGAVYAQSADSAASGEGTEASGVKNTDAAVQPDSSNHSSLNAAAKPDSAAKSDLPASNQYASHDASRTFDVPPPSGDPKFDQAASAFPEFCRDWQRKLHDRELNNLENISWKDQNGWKTATYLSYSPIKTCNCKRSTGGIPIGELTYQETELYLSGRTVEEARHAEPKPVGITNTTEIFRWDRTKWDDGQ